MEQGDPDRRRILLLRGVNVGGVKLPMVGFRAMLEGLGLEGVQTFIQSGNAVFRAEGDPREAIASALKEGFGLASELFLYDLPGFRAILEANPYAEAGQVDGAKVHLFFLARPVTLEVDKLMGLAEGAEALTVTPQAIYFNAPNGIGRSVLAEKLAARLKGGFTARNQRSAEAILALAEAL
jgi:uncharacterized protein (DUF1697 family)